MLSIFWTNKVILRIFVIDVIAYIISIQSNMTQDTFQVEKQNGHSKKCILEEEKLQDRLQGQRIVIFLMVSYKYITCF